MESLDWVPHFIELGDAQDTVLELPIFVTRQVDEATRKQRLATLAVLQKAQSNALERQNNG